MADDVPCFDLVLTFSSVWMKTKDCTVVIAIFILHSWVVYFLQRIHLMVVGQVHCLYSVISHACHELVFPSMTGTMETITTLLETPLRLCLV